jgi:hypothetical protein
MKVQHLSSGVLRKLGEKIELPQEKPSGEPRLVIHLFIIFESEDAMLKFCIDGGSWTKVYHTEPPSINLRGAAPASVISKLYDVISSTSGIKYNWANISTEINNL